jgi:hypothetical protein
MIEWLGTAGIYYVVVVAAIWWASARFSVFLPLQAAGYPTESNPTPLTQVDCRLVYMKKNAKRPG